MLHFHIITLFPESIDAYLSASIIGRAREAKPALAGRPREKAKIKISYYDPKLFAVGKHKRVDQRPYGGGPGMILEPTAVLKAADRALRGKRNVTKIFFSTDGEVLSEAMAKKLSKKKEILLISGRYEGVDARVQKILKARKISVGHYVLTGGELPAATLIDAVSRFVPGVLGKAESLESSRVSSPEVYTRPEILVWKNKKYRVPKILLSGHRAKINEWKTRVKK